MSGRRFFDFHGNGVHHLGFAHPEIVAAIVEQMQRLPFCTRRYTNAPAVELAKQLVQVAPEGLTRVLLAPGGTNAMGIALKLARLATGRYKTVSMWGSFHGASLDVISVGGQALFSDGLGPLLPGAIHVRPPVAEGCMLACGAVCNGHCAEHIRDILEHEGDIAAVVAEPTRWSTVTVPQAEYWQKVRRYCDQYGALLIFDEIGTGFGRTGRWFACEHYGVTPDILVVGKSFGGGIMPLAGIVAREALNIAPDRAVGHYTHEKNPVSCAAALKLIEIIQRDRLVERAESLGQYFSRQLHAALSSFGLYKEVRHQGLLVGVELQDDPQAGDAHQAAEQVMYAAMEQGLSFKVSAGKVLTLVPPLNIEETQLDEVVGILSDCFRQIAITSI